MTRPSDGCRSAVCGQASLADAHSRRDVGVVRESVPLLLLTEQQAAHALGVSHRKFQDLRDQDWCPKPIVLGPRLLRWARAELEQAIANMPRQVMKAEPLRERIKRLKRTAT